MGLGKKIVYSFLLCLVICLHVYAKDTIKLVDQYWIDLLTNRGFNLSASDIDIQKAQAKDWFEAYQNINKLYNKRKSISTSVMLLKIKNKSGLNEINAQQAYRLAIKYDKDPLYLGQLYSEIGDWNKIENALLVAWGYNQSVLNVNMVSNSQKVTVLSHLLKDKTKEEAVIFFSQLYDVNDLPQSIDKLEGDWEEIIPGYTNYSKNWVKSAFQEAETKDNISYIQEDSGNSLPVDPGFLYNAKEVSPYKFYFEQFTEQIDPLSGNLLIKQTDFTLPGKRGLDLELTRIYNSQASIESLMYHTNSSYVTVNSGETSWTETMSENEVYDLKFVYNKQTFTEDNPYQGLVKGQLMITRRSNQNNSLDKAVVYQRQAMGRPTPHDVNVEIMASVASSGGGLIQGRYRIAPGWTWAIPALEMLQYPSDYQEERICYLHLEDGQAYRMSYYSEYGTPSFCDYFLDDMEIKREQVDLGLVGRSEFVLTTKEGLKYYFANDGKLIAKENRFGDKIHYYYEQYYYSQYTKLDKIVDSMNRTIDFTYTASSINARVYSSDMNELMKWDYILDGLNLDMVISLENTSSKYTYLLEPQTIAVAVYTGEDGSPIYITETETAHLLTSVQHPSFGKTQFNYQKRTRGYGIFGKHPYGLSTLELKKDLIVRSPVGKNTIILSLLTLMKNPQVLFLGQSTKGHH